MPYFSQKTIFTAINKLSEIHYIGGKTGNIDTLPIYLFLSKLGINSSNWLDSSELYSNKESGQKIIYELGGCFDLNQEKVESQWCLFFTRFADKNKQFYNAKSNFSQIFSRVKDTIDNSISDHILDKGKDRNYRLKSTYVNNILRMYNQKFSLDALIIWLYRNYEFTEKNINIKQIREYFYQDYNIDYNEAKKLFNLQESISIDFDQNRTNAQEYRKYLKIENLVKFSKIEPQDTFKYKDSITIANLSINNKVIKIEPDLIYQGSHNVIIDVKNKNFNKAILNSDFYQIYTYCKALNTDTGILIYPYYDSAKPIIINPNFDDKIRVYILAIDITKSLDIDINQAQNRFLENIKDIIMYG